MSRLFTKRKEILRHRFDLPMKFVKKYTEIFPKEKDQPSQGRIDRSVRGVDADVIVIGAGIAGASIAHRCGSDGDCRVIVLEQYDYRSSGAQNDSGSGSSGGEYVINHGSSRGGPRRIGTIGGDERIVRAWKTWLDLNQSSVDHDLLDVSGEVYVFGIFPVGLLILASILLLAAFNKCTRREGGFLPDGFQILYTPRMIRQKLGPKQGFRGPECWSGCVGIYHEEAAALHTDRILKYFLHRNDGSSGNLQIRYGSTVTNIEMKDRGSAEAAKIVTVTLFPTGGSASYRLHCRHLVIAAGGWTGALLKGFLQSQRNQEDQPQLPVLDPIKIQDQLEVFTCPVYTVEQSSESGGNTTPPPFTLAAECPIFSCVHKKVYGFPINHERRVREGGPLYLAIRPFYKAFVSEDPADQRVSQNQRKSIDDFVKACFNDTNNGSDAATVTYSHSYTCRYPKLSLDGGKSYRPVFDFVPGSNEQVVVVAGLDGYGFKFGSIYGMEFLELLNTRKGPKGLEWPRKDENGKRNIIQRMVVEGFTKLARYAFASQGSAAEDDREEAEKED